MKVAIVTCFVTAIMAAFHLDFTILPKKLKEVDAIVTRILKSSNLTQVDAQDLVFKLQSYVYNLGPLTRIMPGDPEVYKYAKMILQNGPPNFISVPINYSHIQMSFRWTDVQMTVLNYIYDNAEKHWNDFTNLCKKLNVTDN